MLEKKQQNKKLLFRAVFPDSCIFECFFAVTLSLTLWIAYIDIELLG